MEAFIRIAILVGSGIALWFVCLTLLGLAQALAVRVVAIMDGAARIAAEAVAVAAIWPFEMALILADRVVAVGAEWRDQRRTWRAEYRHSISWQEFRRQASSPKVASPAGCDMAGALDLLGVREPFTRADLDTRFKRLMQGVHPDRGGSECLARMVNDARALILEQKGWKR